MHNEIQVRAKDVRAGDTVIVRRAGDVIPEVKEVVLAKRPADVRPLTVPNQCPVCGSNVEREPALAAINRDVEQKKVQGRVV